MIADPPVLPGTIVIPRDPPDGVIVPVNDGAPGTVNGVPETMVEAVPFPIAFTARIFSE